MPGAIDMASGSPYVSYMTNTRINHSGHNHPATTKARTECRNALNGAVSALLANYARISGGSWTITGDCRRINGNAHDHFYHDDNGQPVVITHHATDRDCAIALVETGFTWHKACMMHS